MWFEKFSLILGHNCKCMRRVLSIIVVAITVLCATSVEARRLWRQGQLCWEDFQGTPALSESRSYMGADIELSTLSDSAGASYAIEAEAVMYPERSYAASDVRTDQYLRYFQARFDLLEVMSRRLRKELASGINGIEADRRLAYYRNLYKSEVDKMDRATSYGHNDQALQMWEYDIRRALESIAVPHAATVVPSAWSYGVFAGVGGLFPVSSVSDVFSGGCVFTFGIMGGWNRIRLHGSIGYSTPTIRDRALVNPDYEGLGYMANVKNANFLDIGFGLGYAVVDTKRFTMEPYVGGDWTGFNWTARPMVVNPDGTTTTSGFQQRMSIDDFNFSCGINFEWHFHSVVTSWPILGSMREQYVSSLRFTPYVIRGVYTDAVRRLSGWHIGFMVSYSGLARALGFK